MRGIILAGGSGSRLYPLSRVTNKHLLPVGKKPMIYYPIETLKQLGCDKILIVTGGNDIGDFMKLLGSGMKFGVDFTYKIQDEAKGIADALMRAEDFCEGEELFPVILGDNIFQFKTVPKIKRAAQVFLYKHDNPERFGVVEWDNGYIKKIIEKPKNPPSNHIVTGLYVYDCSVFDFIKTMKPSDRGELEITDVNNWYLRTSEFTFNIFEGDWKDAGTFESLQAATKMVAVEGGKKDVKRK